MTSLTDRLVGEGTRQDMDYVEESVYSGLATAQNAIILVAKKVEDNILHMTTALVPALQPTVL